MGLINTDRTLGEWVFDTISYTVSIGAIILAAHLYSIDYMPSLTGGMAIGFAVSFITNWSMILLQDNPDEVGYDQFESEEAHATAMVATAILLLTLLTSGLYALFTVNYTAIGIASSILLIALYGVLMTGIRKSLGIGSTTEQDDGNADTSNESDDTDSEWRYDADDFE